MSSLKKIFISSPGDVRKERDIAEAVIDKIGEEFKARWRFQTVRWDKYSEGVMLDARLTPQESVNRQLPLLSECDIVIVILWSRMGTLLPLIAEFKKTDGSAYLSGTEYEYCMAVEEREKRFDETPEILVFHCSREMPDEVANAEDFDEQQRNLKLFLDRIRTEGAGGINDYKTEDEFKEKLESGLRKYLQGKHFAWSVDPIDHDETFVGREEEIEKLINELIAGNDQALVYLPGVGKTTLARVIARNPKLRGKFHGVLWADVGKDTSYDEIMKKWANALEIPDETISKLATYNDWYKAIEKEISERSNLLIVLDDVWSLKGNKDLRSLGKECTYLVTTRLNAIASSLCGENNVTLIKPLPRKQSLQLLQAYAPKEIAVAQAQYATLLNSILISLDGLPLALEVTGKNLRGKYNEGKPDRLKRALERIQEAGALFENQNRNLKDWGSKRLIPLLDVYYEDLDNEDLKRALCAVSVFRPNPHTFSEEIAIAVCAVSDELLEPLEEAGFINVRSDGQYVMHRAISEYANAKLAPDERIELHTKALQYYEDAINQLTPGKDMLSYASWYRYEKAEWQGLQQARLYHLAAARPDSDWAVGQAILRIYFDAFWWWGYYQPFAFCDALIEKWQHKTQARKVKEILDTLRIFGENYPAGYDKKDESGLGKIRSSWPDVEPGWPSVRKALDTLRKTAELDSDIASLTPEQQHIRGLMDFFLAESFAYADEPDLPQAMQTYESARSTFETLGDSWIHSWILFYMADLIKDKGVNEGEREASRTKARTYCEDSIKLAECMPFLDRDPELLGNIYRVIGDLDFTTLNYALAAKDYFYASAYAYMFQGIPSPPDSYTTEFYREITGKVSSRIAELRVKDSFAGKQLFDELNRYWTPYRMQVMDESVVAETLVTADDISACLFPRPPKDDDTENNLAIYQANVKSTVNAAMFTALI